MTCAWKDKERGGSKDSADKDATAEQINKASHRFLVDKVLNGQVPLWCRPRWLQLLSRPDLFRLLGADLGLGLPLLRLRLPRQLPSTSPPPRLAAQPWRSSPPCVFRNPCTPLLFKYIGHAVYQSGGFQSRLLL